jgi:aminoglycoside phosphotransferase (APT) family kinase protein
VAETRQLCLNVIDKLIALHKIDYVAAGLEGIGKGKGYVRRQVAGWSERYRNARTADVGGFEKIMAWLERTMPPEDVATCVIHNDYRFDNVVLNPANPLSIVGVLDWEMATLGDPLMDLGNALAYWVQADDDEFFKRTRCQPTHLPGMLTRREVAEYYSKQTGREINNFEFYHVFGLFRLAVIVQQIYFRYSKGQSANPQFAHFGQLVNYLEQRCARLMDEAACG